MATKKNPADAAVAYFETAPLESALAVLAICKGIVGRRQPTTRAPRTKKTPSTTTTIPAAPVQ